MKRKAFLFIFFYVVGVLALKGQQAPDWSTRLSQIEWLRVTSLGYPVVSSLSKLSALDPESGEIVWQQDNLGTLRYEQVEEIWGTPYLKISHGTEQGDDAAPMITLVNMINGAVTFDSGKEKLGVLGSYGLAKSGRFMVVGVQPGKFSAKLLMYDMETGNKLWENDDIFKGEQGKGGLLGKVAGAVQSVLNMTSLTSDPVEIDNDHLIITHPNYVIKLNSATGATVWRAKINESSAARLLVTDAKPNVIYVGTELESESMMSSGSGPPTKTFSSTYYAFDINTGQAVWNSPVRNNNERLNVAMAAPKGLLIMPGFSTNQQKTTLNLLDYGTGNGLWGAKGKGIRIDGAVVDYLPTGQGLVLSTSALAMNQNKGENFFLNVLDIETGTLRFAKAVKVNGRLVTTEETPRGILYTTTMEVNIIDPASGARVLSNSIESGGPKRPDRTLPFPTASRGNNIYVYATREGIIKELNKVTGMVRNVNTVKLELGGKELPKSLDAFDEGIVVCSDQNVIMIGYDGLLKFSHYFNPPKQSGLMRALALAEAVKGAYLTLALTASSVAYAGYASQSDNPEFKAAAYSVSGAMSGMAAYSLAYTGKALADFNKRFKATTTTDDYLIVLSEVTPRNFRLLKVDKRTGKTLTTLDLGKDRDPVYDLDAIYQYIYHMPTYNEIHCFKLKM